MFDLFFFKQKTAYEMRISDWSSDVCSSDLPRRAGGAARLARGRGEGRGAHGRRAGAAVMIRRSASDIDGEAARHVARMDRDDWSDAQERDLQDWLARDPRHPGALQIGRAHVCTPVTNAHLVSRHLLEKKKIRKHLHITRNV